MVTEHDTISLRWGISTPHRILQRTVEVCKMISFLLTANGGKRDGNRMNHEASKPMVQKARRCLLVAVSRQNFQST